MGIKIVAPPGTPAADLEALAERERALAGKEAELLALGSELEGAARARLVKLEQVREALQGLAASSVAKEAEAAFVKAMGIAVPPHVVSPSTIQALEQRRKAVAMRELALHAEYSAIEARRKRLPAVDAEIEALQAEAAALGRKAEADEAAARAEAAAEKERQGEERARTRAERAAAPASSAPAALMNRRASPRVALQVEVTMQSESNFFTGFSGDISETGVFVATYQKLLSPGTLVELTLAIPGEPPMPLSGAVRWVREAGAPGSGTLPGMGISFAELGEKETKAIQRFICGREPLFWSE